MNWELYVNRRRINVPSWISANGVKNRDDFVRILDGLGVEPPGDDVINALLPKEIPENKDEPANGTPEGSDQVTTRSVAAEGDRTNLRSDRKRSSKVRSQ